MTQLKQALILQQQELEELTTEVQRKEITPDRFIRLIRVARQNNELMQRMVRILEALGARDLPDATDVPEADRSDISQRLATLAKAHEELKKS